MKRILFVFFFLVLTSSALAQSNPPLTVQEADSSPKKTGITKIVVTNGSLTISGTTATIVTGGGGGGGSPGGSTTQVQYNDTGAFAGAAGFTFNGTSTITLGVAGTSVGAVAFKNATSGTITLQPVTGALGTVTLSLPAATDTLVGLAATQTLTNKTLTAPVIATISNTGTLTLPTSTDTLVGKATTDTFTNKTLTASSNVLGGVTMTLGSDADGDIYYRASNVLTRLPKGTALQVLRMNAGATAPEWAAASGGGGITIGTTTITSGTDTRVLYNNAGVVGEYAVTGTGNAVLSASPTLTGTVAAAAATFSGAITQTSASATAFESGPNGGTNPVFRLVNSTASAATGLSITGNAAGSGVTLTALSSGGNEGIAINSKGTGAITLTSGSSGITFAAGGGNLILSYGSGAMYWGDASARDAFIFAGIFRMRSDTVWGWSTTTNNSTGYDTTLVRAAANVVRIANGSTGAGGLLIGTSSASITGSLTVLPDNAATNSIVDIARLGVNSTGTAASGFGGQLSFSAETSTTNDQQAGSLGWLWTDATHASRTGAITFSTVSAAGSNTERLRVDHNGLTLAAVLFANLASTNGILSYCSDCAVTSVADNTCAGSGTGALAIRLNGTWRCFIAQN